MRDKYKPLLYIFMVILVVIGLALLFLRQPLFEALRVQVGISSIDIITRKSPPASELIDMEILKSNKLVNLKSNVKVFVFEETCGASVSTPKRCVQGNSNPFIKNKK